MFYFGFLLLLAVFAASVDACDDGLIAFDGNLEKCATDPLSYLGDFDCAFFWHDNCGGRRLGECLTVNINIHTNVHV